MPLRWLLNGRLAIRDVPVSIVRNQHLLSEAFELVGRRLFGTEWNGSEWGARFCLSPDDMLRARAPHVEALQRIERELAEIDGRIKRTLDGSEIRQLEQRRQVAWERRTEVGQQLFSFPEPTETIAWMYASHQRKLKAEGTLIDAIKQGKIQVQNGRGLVIDNLLWRGHPNFHYSIELSVRVPSSFSSTKVQPARIPEHDFDVWLSTLAPLTPSAEKQLSPREQCRTFLQRRIAAGRQDRAKEVYFREARAEIPGLSERAFESVWSELAPASWKQSGRRSWPKESRHPAPKR